MSKWKELMARSDAYATEIKSVPHKTYAVNPFVDVYTDTDAKGIYHLHFPTLDKGASAWMHLVVGEEKALLIDTAFGIGDLKGLVECLTDKPIIVFNTHYHGDHTQGNGWFESVYIHEYDVPYLQATIAAGAQGRFYPHIAHTFTENDLTPAGGYDIIPVHDGYTFDLGDRKLEVIHMPGHSAGGAMLLDETDGILFSGDAVVFTPTLIIGRFPNQFHGELMTVKAFYDSLEKALPRLKSVNKLYTGHSVQGIGSMQLRDMLECLRAILDKPQDHELYDYVDDPSQKQIMCKGNAMVVYTDDRIR